MNKNNKMKKIINRIFLKNRFKGRVRGRYVILGTIVLLVFVLLIDAVFAYFQLLPLKDEIISQGEEIQISFHREFQLVERINLVDISEFTKDCTKFSFSCLYDGYDIRNEMIREIETQSFDDSSMEVLNMISSVEVSTKEKIDKFNFAVADFEKRGDSFPLNIVSWMFGKIASLE